MSKKWIVFKVFFAGKSVITTCNGLIASNVSIGAVLRITLFVFLDKKIPFRIFRNHKVLTLELMS